MRRFIFVILLVVSSRTAMGQEKPIATISRDRSRIEISFTSGQEMSARLAHSAGDRKLYSLVELEPVGEPGVISRDRSDWLNQAETARCVGANCQRLEIRLDHPLPAGQTFILAIANFTEGGEAITLRFEPPVQAAATPAKVDITAGPDFFSQSSELQLRASEDVRVNPNVVVQRVHYTISSDGLSEQKVPEPINASVRRVNDRIYVLKLGKKLALGQEYLLEVDNGITDSLGQPVVAKGTVKVRPVPSKAEELGIDINLSSDVAVHQRPIFQFIGKYKGTNIRGEEALFGEWRWEPTASADVGLNSTKSANAVTLEPFNLVNEFINLPLDEYPGTPPQLRTQTTGLPPTRPKAYANWLYTSKSKFSNLKVTVGPKFEFDRNFKRKNILGGARFDFNFHRWHATIADKRELLKRSFGDEIGARARVRFGMEIVPFVAFNFGGHVNNETVHKKVNGVEQSVFVPRHKIFRSYAGFTSTFEFDDIGTPLTITIEEALLHLAARETIGFTNDNGAFLRSLTGFHHRGKATFAFNVGRSKHYSLVLTYENGRQAPNLEYLNKLGTGIKILY